MLYDNGVYRVVVATSSDGGVTWGAPQVLASYGDAASGRVIAFAGGSRVVEEAWSPAATS